MQAASVLGECAGELGTGNWLLGSPMRTYEASYASAAFGWIPSVLPAASSFPKPQKSAKPSTKKPLPLPNFWT